MHAYEVWIRDRDLPLLRGEHVQLIPFAPDILPEDVLVHAWQRFRDDGTLERMFWNDPSAVLLRDFLRYWDTKALFLAMTLEPKMIGLVWLADIHRWHRAEIGVAMYRHLTADGIPGGARLTREAVWLLLEWATKAQKLSLFWMRSPWREAGWVARACGAVKAGVLPAFHQ